MRTLRLFRKRRNVKLNQYQNIFWYARGNTSVLVMLLLLPGKTTIWKLIEILIVTASVAPISFFNQIQCKLRL